MLGVVDAKTLGTLQASPTNAAAATTAVGEIVKGLKVTPAVALSDLESLAKLPPADGAFLAAHGTQLGQAAANSPGQWKDWWWVCVGGMVVFIPFIWVMKGRWSPRKAKQDADEHEARVAEELAALQKADA